MKSNMYTPGKWALSIACLSLSFAVSAQSPFSGKIHLPEIWKEIKLPPAQKSTAQKPTSTQSRLISLFTASYDGAGFIPDGDSAALSWSGTRGANFDVERLLGYNFLNEFPQAPVDVWSQNYFQVDSIRIFGYNAASGTFDALKDRTIGTLDASGNLIAATYFKWNTGTNTWDLQSKNMFTYNAGNLMTSRTGQNWSGSVWENDDKDIYELDSKGNLTSVTQQNWNNAGSTWENDYKHTYTYDAQDNLLSEVSQDWTAGAWENVSKTTNVFDANNHMQTSIEQDWTSGAWANYAKYTFSYDAGQKRETDIYQRWNAGTMTWENRDKFTYAYDGAGKCTSYVQQEWAAGSWKDAHQLFFEYSGNKFTKLYMQNRVAEEWINQDQLLLERSSYGQLTKLTQEKWNAGGFWEIPVGSGQYRFFYEEFEGSSVKKVNNLLSLKVYPNPADQVLHLQSGHDPVDALTILDYSGKVVYRSHLKTSFSTLSLPTGQLAAGVYLLQVRSGAVVDTRTFVVQR